MTFRSMMKSIVHNSSRKCLSSALLNYSRVRLCLTCELSSCIGKMLLSVLVIKYTIPLKTLHRYFYDHVLSVRWGRPGLNLFFLIKHLIKNEKESGKHPFVFIKVLFKLNSLP